MPLFNNFKELNIWFYSSFICMYLIIKQLDWHCLFPCCQSDAPPPRTAKPTPAPPKEEGDEGEDNIGGEEGEENEDEHENTLCGACGDNYAGDEFWICCDACEKWFHGKCVKITPARAEHIKQYKCPGCSNKRARAWWLVI